MKNTKINIYKKFLQKVCENFNDAEAFVREKIEQLCTKKKLSAEEVIYQFMNDYNNFSAVC